MTLQKIEIDWDIHKLIEQERRGFGEAPYVALRRLLELPQIEPKANRVTTTLSDGVPWKEDGVIVPHGSRAKMEYDYKRQVFEGEFKNGKLVVNGASYDTLSAAASELATTRAGQKTQLNGWIYWQVCFPGEEKWRRLGEMRSELRKSS